MSKCEDVAEVLAFDRQAPGDASWREDEGVVAKSLLTINRHQLARGVDLRYVL